jgi:hypothetical protein
MDLVFNNVYLLEAICATDPSLEVFFKLLMSVPLFARYVQANKGVRQSLYRLHEKWLNRRFVDFITLSRLEYRHPYTGELHRLSGPAFVGTYKTKCRTRDKLYFVNGKFRGSTRRIFHGPRELNL